MGRTTIQLTHIRRSSDCTVDIAGATIGGYRIPFFGVERITMRRKWGLGPTVVVIQTADRYIKFTAVNAAIENFTQALHEAWEDYREQACINKS